MIPIRIFPIEKETILSELKERNISDITENVIKNVQNKIVQVKMKTLLSRIQKLGFQIRETSTVDKLPESGEINYSYKYPVPEGRDVWVDAVSELFIGKSRKVLFLLKPKQGIDYLLKKVIDMIQDKSIKTYTTALFGKNDLKSFTRNILEHIEDEGNSGQVIRAIFKKVYLNNEFFDEINLKIQNLQLQPLFSDMLKSAEIINAMTYKIYWTSKTIENEKGELVSPKPLTFRLDKYGKMLIYGEHPEELVFSVLNYVDDALQKLH